MAARGRAAKTVLMREAARGSSITEPVETSVREGSDTKLLDASNTWSTSFLPVNYDNTALYGMLSRPDDTSRRRLYISSARPTLGKDLIQASTILPAGKIRDRSSANFVLHNSCTVALELAHFTRSFNRCRARVAKHLSKVKTKHQQHVL